MRIRVLWSDPAIRKADLDPVFGMDPGFHRRSDPNPGRFQPDPQHWLQSIFAMDTSLDPVSTLVYENIGLTILHYLFFYVFKKNILRFGFIFRV